MKGRVNLLFAVLLIATIVGAELSPALEHRAANGWWTWLALLAASQLHIFFLKGDKS